MCAKALSDRISPQLETEVRKDVNSEKERIGTELEKLSRIIIQDHFRSS